MSSSMLTIFANFRIDNEERYQRMKDSFMSFKDIDAKKWVINVRGSYKLKTIFFLKEHLGERLYPNMLESGKGWFHDSRSILSQIDTEFIFFWIEDHINMIDPKEYKKILSQMKECNVDHLVYSFWHNSTKEKFKNIECLNKINFSIYHMDFETVSKIENSINKYFYTISAVGFFSDKLFKKIIYSEHPILKRWPKETPFDFEKRSTDRIFLPFKLAIPNYELFACIDDDHGEEGYSLISRGVYRSRILRDELKSIEFKPKSKKFVKLKCLIPLVVLNKIRFINSIIKRIKMTWID